MSSSGSTLKLTISKEAFFLLITGEKQFEFRKKSKWMQSRLFCKDTDQKKDYDYVKFTNGYGANRPFAVFVYSGVRTVNNVQVMYSTGLQIKEKKEMYCIKIGSMVHCQNLIAKDYDECCEQQRNVIPHTYQF